jgi:aldehyde dehydrogenase (NAD+)
MDFKFAPAPESADIADIKATYGLFIDGKFVKATGGKTFTTYNPANSKHLAKIADASAADTVKALKAAQSAGQGVWKKMSGAERGKYLFRIARMIQERARELAVAESLDGGKPIRESRDFDVPMAAAHFFYYAGWADKLEYAFPGANPAPLGVVAQIVPWNFPLLMAAWKIAPALACGNTVVLKPAEQTSLTALKLAEIIQDCDLPPGVVNVVTGGPEVGKSLVNSDIPAKIAFTGSTEVGKYIQKQVAGTDKHLTLELGGKAAHIVLEDAALNQAVEGVVNGIFFNQGHVCCAGSRLLLQESIADGFIEKLKKRMRTLVVGDPLDKNTDIGAINNKEQFKRIQHFINSGKEEGLTVFQCPTKLPDNGYFIAPTLLLNAAQSSRVVQEEIFGPVLSIQTFRTVDEAIEKANNVSYGLSAGVWSEKGSRIFNITRQLNAGVVWANTYNKFDPASPFGGYKESGFGREGGVHGLHAYLKINI